MKSLCLVLLSCFSITAKNYSIQWGAFDSTGALNLVDSLRNVEVPVYTTQAVVKGVNYTRVRTGPFKNISQAQQAASLLNISTPYLVQENALLDIIDIENLIPTSFAGMIPVIIRDSISMPKDSCDRVFCFNYPRFRDVELNELMEQYYAGFYDPMNGRVISLFEGINRIQPLATDNNYLMIREYTGWGPGAFHPYYQYNYLLKNGADSLIEVAVNLGDITVTDDGFYGVESRGTFTFQMSNTSREELGSDTVFYNNNGDKNTLVSKVNKLPLILKGSTLYGDTWSYELSGFRGKIFSIGKDLFAVVVVTDTTIDSEEFDCCDICHFSSDVYIFKKSGFIKKIHFPVSGNISPFLIELHEDPCSA